MTATLVEPGAINGREGQRSSRLFPAIVWVFAAYATLPGLVGLLQAGRQAGVLTVAVADQTAPTHGAVLLRTVLKLILFGVCALGIAEVRHGRQLMNVRGVAPLLLVWLVVVVSALSHDSPTPFAVITLPLVAVAIAGASPRVQDLAHVARAGAAIALLSLVMALLTPGLSYLVSDEPKILPGVQLLAGPFSHPNTLGQAMALCLPLALCFERGRRRAVEVVLLATALLMSGSRSSLMAVAGAVVCLLLVRALPRTPFATPRFAARLVLPMTFAFLCVNWLVVTTAGPLSYTGRGQIWGPSLTAWRQSRWLGRGPDYFSKIALVNNDLLNVAFHAHNQFVHMLTISGLLGLGALILVVVIALWRTSSYPWAAAGASWLAAWLLMGTFEVPSDFFSLQPLSMFCWIPFATLLVVGASQVEAKRGSQRSESRKRSAQSTRRTSPGVAP